VFAEPHRAGKFSVVWNDVPGGVLASVVLAPTNPGWGNVNAHAVVSGRASGKNEILLSREGCTRTESAHRLLVALETLFGVQHVEQLRRVETSRGEEPEEWVIPSQENT
jgi:hypothetical protein